MNQADKLATLATLLEQSTQSLKLATLFNTRNSGWSNSAAFHAACDDKGPTLVLIQCSDGTGYGGYTSLSWRSTNHYQIDAKAFLFRIHNFASTVKQTPEKLARTGAGNDIYTHGSHGPTFGGGHDLTTIHSNKLALGCNQSSFNTSGPLITSTVPKDANNYEMEVLSVGTATATFAEELEAPWLTGCAWSSEVKLYGAVHYAFQLSKLAK